VTLPEPIWYSKWIGKCPLVRGVRVGFYGNDAVGPLGPDCTARDRCPRWGRCPVMVFLEYCGKVPSAHKALLLEEEAARRGKNPWDLSELAEALCGGS